MRWRAAVGTSVYVDTELGEDGMATETAKYLVNSYFSRGNKLATASNKLMAVQNFHHMAGITIPMQHH